MARRPIVVLLLPGPFQLLNEPLFSGGIEKWSSYDGPMIGWRVDPEVPERAL